MQISDRTFEVDELILQERGGETELPAATTLIYHQPPKRDLYRHRKASE